MYGLVSAPALREYARLVNFAAMDYDGENLAERLLRRSQRWAGLSKRWKHSSDSGSSSA